jgi:hypothetical protein
MKLDEIDRLDVAEAAELLEAATIIEARRDLRLLKISVFGHLKHDDQVKLHKEIYAEAYPEEMSTVRPVGPAELKGMGFG